MSNAQVVNVHQAKTHLSRLLERVAEGEEITIAKAGTPIGPNDLMIAAIALAHHLTLVTHNTTEFSRVPGLSIEDWQIP